MNPEHWIVQEQCWLLNYTAEGVIIVSPKVLFQPIPVGKCTKKSWSLAPTWLLFVNLAWEQQSGHNKPAKKQTKGGGTFLLRKFSNSSGQEREAKVFQ